MELQVNMVVIDAREAGDYYKQALNAEILSQTDLETNMNETVIKLGDAEIKILNENVEMGLVAPTKGTPSSMWLNLIVDNIEEFFANTQKYDFYVVSPVTEFPNGAKNCVLADKYNHFWVVNQKF